MSNLHLCFFSALILLMSGCASKPTLGDKMLSQAGGTQEIGNKWNEGNELVIEGEKKREKGQELEKEGKEEIEEGESMLRKGKQLMEESERAFHKRFPSKSLY